jgi:hypothetical protein
VRGARALERSVPCASSGYGLGVDVSTRRRGYGNEDGITRYLKRWPMDASELNVILEGVLTVATVVLAFYTASMANQTRRVAIKTAELSEETKLLAQETVAATD